MVSSSIIESDTSTLVPSTKNLPGDVIILSEKKSTFVDASRGCSSSSSSSQLSPADVENPSYPSRPAPPKVTLINRFFSKQFGRSLSNKITFPSSAQLFCYLKQALLHALLIPLSSTITLSLMILGKSIIGGHLHNTPGDTTAVAGAVGGAVCAAAALLILALMHFAMEFRLWNYPHAAYWFFGLLFLTLVFAAPVIGVSITMSNDDIGTAVLWSTLSACGIIAPLVAFGLIMFSCCT